MKKNIIFGIMVSAVFLYLALNNVNFGEMWVSLKGANYWYVIPYSAFIIFGMWVRAYRWRFMTDHIKKITLRSLFSSTMIGFMAINLLPARLGEVVRAYSLGAKENISKSATFATIILERIFDLIALLALVWFTLVFFPTPDEVKKVGYLTLILIAAILMVLYFLKTKTRPTLDVLEKPFMFLKLSWRNKAKELFEKFATGLTILVDFKTLWLVVLISVLLWFATALSNYLIFLAFNIQPPIYASFILLIFVAFGISLPSSPGFIGTFQFACVLALKFFKIPESTAFSISVVLWVGNFLPVTLIGLYYLKKEHFSLKRIQTEELVQEG
ncbi:MAG: hypothetical protein A2Z27_00620 [candidate division Zixibacteria bacterium RBG_16_50_21]|nr:MAG: hypothetical protein A2Z27_00620 [candidate division Zixibacteria bacterium RBG_16_50_21]